MSGTVESNLHKFSYLILQSYELVGVFYPLYVGKDIKPKEA